MTSSTTQPFADAIAIADHAARIKTLEGWVKDLSKQLDRIQWLLVLTLAGIIVQLLRR